MRARRHPAPARRFPLRAPAHGLVALAIFLLVLAGGALPATLPGSGAAPPLRVAAFSPPGVAASAPLQVATSLAAAPLALTVRSSAGGSGQVLNAADSTSAAVNSLQDAQRTGGAAGAAAATREPEQSPKYYRYAVQPGDTLAAIAVRFGIDVQYIEWNNAELINDANLLPIGLVLQIPSVPGIIHGVRSGETLTEIAERYDASVQDLIDFPANGLSDPNQLADGALILVVGGRRLPPPAATLRPATPAPAPAVVDRQASGFGFSWPVVGLITSYLSPSHPLGIDINAPYVPVAAAAAGRVVFVGGDPCCSYGRYIEIDHGSGYVTLYGHLASFAVVKDQWVERGQVIAVSGNTGNSTGAHLHFELHRNGVIMNPLQFLP